MSTKNRHRTTPSLGDLVDLARQLTADREASASALRHRDRELGRSLPDHLAPVAQVLAWLDALRGRQADAVGPRVDAAHRLGLVVLAIAGAGAGWGAAAVVFFYDGRHPVNVIHVLAVFVLLQLVLSLFFALANLPGRVFGIVPGLASLLDSLRLISPGGIQRLAARSLPQSARTTLDDLVGRGQQHARLHGGVDRWTLAHSTQVFALLFNVGALVSALWLVIFSDLAFAWSTTLTVDGGDLQRWTDALSAPWALMWPDARPSPELISVTRYFRLGDGTFPDAPQPAGLGGWWPFLIAAMAFYGVVPRVVTLLIARARWRAALRRAVRHYPGVDDLTARLAAELVELNAETPEQNGPAEPTTAPPALTDALHAGPVAMIDWAGAASDRDAMSAWLGATATIEPASWHEAGGASTPAADREVIANVAATDATVVVLVRAWEPPMADLLDVLRDLRRALGDGRTLAVLPVGADSGGAPITPEPHHLDLWRRTLTRVGDPWLRLFAVGGHPA